MSRAWRVFTLILLAPAMAGLLHVYITVFSTGGAPLLAAAIALVCLLIGCVALYVHEKPKDPPRTQPFVQVDWALSDVCLHVSCPCPQSANKVHHLDGYTFGRFRCPDCGNRFTLPTRLDAHQLAE